MVTPDLRTNEILSHFDKITLCEMDPCKFMDRFDKKFIFHSSLIPEILSYAGDFYRVLEIQEKRMMKYSSTYLDTDNHEMYLHHHNGKGKRYKIRIREYFDTGDQFLEVKDKSNRGDVKKVRISIQTGNYRTESCKSFIKKNTPYDLDVLSPKIFITFTRITLTGKKVNERVTIDKDIYFEHNGIKTSFLNLGVAEIKKANISEYSEIDNIMKNLGVRSENFSKYCTGTTQLYNGIKMNRFKTKLTKIKTIENELIYSDDIRQLYGT
jgi:hypothetical protein